MCHPVSRAIHPCGGTHGLRGVRHSGGRAAVLPHPLRGETRDALHGGTSRAGETRQHRLPGTRWQNRARR